MMTFLEVNGIVIDCTDEELTETGLAVAAGIMDYDNLLELVLIHRQ